MGLHVFWPACATLTLFVVFVIMVLIKYGEKLCGRLGGPPRDYQRDAEYVEEGGYARDISESVA